MLISSHANNYHAHGVYAACMATGLACHAGSMPMVIIIIQTGTSAIISKANIVHESKSVKHFVTKVLYTIPRSFTIIVFDHWWSSKFG